MGEAFLDYKKGGSGGLDINGIIEDYYVYAGEKVSAGGFVEFVNGVAGRVDYGTSSSTIFSISNLQNVCSCLVDTNKVLVVFSDSTANNCKAVVATVNGAEITYGTICTVNSTNVDYISMAFVSTNKVAISYSYGGYLAQVAIITVSGTSITVGTALTVGSGSSSYPDYWTQVIALDETHLLVTWDRNRNSSSTTYGLKACVLTINNTTLSAGTVLSLEGYQHYYLSLCKLNSTSAILFYGDAQNSEYGTARVLQISGTTITSGAEYVFQSSRTLYIDSCLVDTNKVMIYYHDNSNGSGKAIIAQVSGTSVAFGSVYTLPIGRSHGGIATIDTNKAILVYRGGNQAGTAITATVSGTVIEFGTPYTFSNLIDNVNFGVTMISNDTALVAYANYVDSTNVAGTTQLLGISDTEISNNITKTAYETQVRPATSLPCDGVAKSSGEGGDSTGHKDIVSVYKAYKACNLIVNGDFNNGLNGWATEKSIYELSVETTNNDNYMVATMISPSSTTGSLTKVFATSKEIISNHVFYARLDMKGVVTNKKMTAVLRVDYVNPTTDFESYCQLCADLENYNNAEWVRISGINTLPVSDIIHGVRLFLSSQNVDGTLTSGMKLYFDNVKLYDLTAMFGAGNEPTQEWCDANL